MNLLSISRIWFVFYILTNISRMHYLQRWVTIISLVYYEFTIFRANSLSIQFLFREFTIFHANSPWIHFLFLKSTMNSLSFSEIHYEQTIHFANSLSVSRILYEFTIYLQIYYEFILYFTNSAWIHCLFRELTRNILSIFWIRFESNFHFANKL